MKKGMFFFRYHGTRDAHTIFSSYHHQARWKILKNNNIKFMRIIGIWIKNVLKEDKMPVRSWRFVILSNNIIR